MFTTPWPTSAYRRELKNPESNRYIVARYNGAGRPAVAGARLARAALAAGAGARPAVAGVRPGPHLRPAPTPSPGSPGCG